MVPWSRRGALALGCTLLLFATPAPAEPDGTLEGGSVSASPVGIGSAAAPAILVRDPLFDDEYDDDYGDEIGAAVNDPIEGTNRAVFTFNQKIDDVFWKPITRGYQFVVPEIARESIRRVFVNLNTPIYLVNNLLQLRFKEAAETTGAFLLNTTIGVGGLLEPAKEAGWEPRPADFGQTLGVVGVGSGPYLVIPLLGPSTVRDAFGDVVDRAFHPLTYFIGPWTQAMVGGGYGLSMREAHDAQLSALEASAVDFYALMRSAYAQHRDAMIAQHRRSNGSGPAENATPGEIQATSEAY